MRVYWNAILVSSKYYTALPILNKQRFAPVFFFLSESSNKRETNILAVVRFKTPFERDAFRFNILSALFRETTFKQGRNSSLLSLCVNHSLFMLGNETTSILRLRRSTHKYSCPALKMISNANSAAVQQNKLIFFLLAR